VADNVADNVKAPPPEDRKKQAVTLPLGVKAARVALVVLGVLGALLSLLPGGRAIYRAGLLLPAVLTTSQPAPIAASGGDVRHSHLTLPSRGGTVYLDIYAPADPAPRIPGGRAALIIIPGVGDNRQELPLINLNESLARAGFVAVDLTTTALMAFALTPDDADSVVVAVQRVASLPDVGQGRVGIVGLSAGGALACLAAADPRIQGQLAFIALFGGYYDATTLIHDVGRRALLVDGKLAPWQPQAVPINVLAESVAPTLPDADAAKLTNALGPNESGTLGSLSDDELRGMSPGAVAAYHLLMGDQPERVEANIAALPQTTHDLFRALSPSSVVGSISTPLYLLHDAGDEYVPFTESQAFDAALTRLHRSHEFVELTVFTHVEVKSNEGLGALVGDGAHLFSILYQIFLVAS
jgi:dienelactone hydrolase